MSRPPTGWRGPTLPTIRLAGALPGLRTPPGPRSRLQVFYIHPTTYLERDRWNAPLQPGGETEFRTKLFVQSQASAFNGAGQVWAPRYRQAAFGAFLLKSEDAQEALDFAYSRRGRGVRSVPVARYRRIARSSSPATARGRCTSSGCCGRRSRASRSPGGSSPLTWSDGRSALCRICQPSACRPARSADQAGCILSWMTFGDPANPDFIFHEWAKTTGLNGGERRQQDMLCVNPITGTEGGAARRCRTIPGRWSRPRT